MEEESLRSSLETYRTQLGQVGQAIQAAGETEDLVTLQRDLQEVIQLTEESLLSLRKSELLRQLGNDDDDDYRADSESTGTSQTTPQIELDDEYAAFQAMLSDDVSTSATVTSAPDSKHASTSNLTEVTDVSTSDLSEVADIYNDIIGTKCRAPFIQDWGEKSFGNAMIAGVEVESEMEIPKVCVMFCNPTHASMLPCRYFLEGSCKFTEDNCRYSHGCKVKLEDLQEFEEPDYSLLKMESACLARFDDDLWYRATVVDLHDDEVSVTFDSYKDDDVVKLPLEDIWPLDHTEDSDRSADEEEEATKDGGPISREDSDDEEALPVYLWKQSSHGLGDLGQWEAHTKGIGSRLMSLMGYVPGKGLGKSGEGRIEPVPIQLIPKGKSLDMIMQLREKSGDRNMFDAVTRLEKKAKKHAEKLANDYVKKSEQTDLFNFINHRLGGKKGKLSELVHKHEGQGQKKPGQGKLHRTISEQELGKKSDRGINIQLLKTGGEIRSVQKELTRLRQGLSRNENRDRKMSAQLKKKIEGLESYLVKLRTSETTMTSHQQKRSDHRKLTVF